jgi:hypothetical protein
MCAPFLTWQARVIVVLSDEPDVFAVLHALATHGFYSSGYAILVLHSRGWSTSPATLAQVASLIGDDASGLLFVDRAPQPPTPRQAALYANWTSLTTMYNASEHGTYNATSGAPLYSAADAADVSALPTSSAPIWDVGARAPDTWGQLMYDTVWLYATALDALTRAGVPPTTLGRDGSALRQELLRTAIDGLTGRLSLDTVTQARARRRRRPWPPPSPRPRSAHMVSTHG